MEGKCKGSKVKAILRAFEAMPESADWRLLEGATRPKFQSFILCSAHPSNTLAEAPLSPDSENLS